MGSVAESPIETLLEVQSHDLAVDQLRYRRQSLAERAQLAAVERSLTDLAQQLETSGNRLSDLERVQRRLEDEIDSIEAKAVDSELRLYSGTVQAPRELQALADEVEGLRRRKRHLEDELLDGMEQAEPVAAEVTRLEEERSRLEADASRLRAAIVAQEAEIDAELAAEVEARTGLVAGIPADLLATYEQLRQRLGGIGVARLDAGRCSGCHLSLPAQELDALRRAAPEEIVRHEECGRILAR